MTDKQKNIWRGLMVGGIVVWGASLAAAKVFVPQANPVARYGGVIVNSEVDASLKRACFDCHSNETQWPWYTYLPVVGALVAHDVAEGRALLNFSEWASMDAEARAKALEESGEEIQEGEMPMDIYLWMHPEARLSEAETALLASFSAETTGSAGGEQGGEGEDDGEDDDDE